MWKELVTCVAVLGTIVATSSSAQPTVSVSVTPDRLSYAPGDTFVLGIEVRIPHGYHLYGNPLGPGIGLPLTLSVRPLQSLRWLDLTCSPPEKYQPPVGSWVWAYTTKAYLFLRGVVASDVSGQIRDTLDLSGLMCKESCTKFAEQVEFLLRVDHRRTDEKRFAGSPALAASWVSALPMPLDTGAAPEQTVEAHLSLDDYIPEWDFEPVSNDYTGLGLGLALVLAFLAGIVLNVMPCVLPVLGIKVLSLAQGHQSRRQALASSLAFAAGMVAVFMVLASLAAFAGLSWGQQFQKPAFLVGIVCLVFFFALGMFDMYLLLVPATVGQAERRAGRGLGGDFARGAFATVLATPCSGPFLGATLAWVLTQPPVTVFAVFLALGLGMACPYVLLALSKRLLALIPKPGAWMEDFKHALGFFLIGFAIYLMIGLPRDMVLSTVGLCAVIAFAVWLYGRLAPYGAGAGRTAGALSVSLAAFVGGFYLCFGILYPMTSERAAARVHGEHGGWQPFTPDRLLEALDDGRNVVVDFTANWCMNCQYNMVAVLQSKAVRRSMERAGVVALLADLTSPNPAAESLMRHLGSRSVPFLAVFSAADPRRPVIMRDVLSRRALLRVLERLPRPPGTAADTAARDSRLSTARP